MSSQPERSCTGCGVARLGVSTSKEDLDTIACWLLTHIQLSELIFDVEEKYRTNLQRQPTQLRAHGALGRACARKAAPDPAECVHALVACAQDERKHQIHDRNNRNGPPHRLRAAHLVRVAHNVNQRKIGVERGPALGSWTEEREERDDEDGCGEEDGLGEATDEERGREGGPGGKVGYEAGGGEAGAVPDG